MKNLNSISFKASEVPKEYYLMKYYSNALGRYDSLLHHMQDERIIEFEISANSIDNLSALNLLEGDESGYLSSGIANDFSVVTTQGDTVACIGVHFEQANRLAPFKRLILYFDNINSDKQVQLLYRDHLYGMGELKFDFDFAPVKL